MLRPAGRTRFQDLFHSPRRGAFHLSLTVLVHYRSAGYLALGRGRPCFPPDFSCPVVLTFMSHARSLGSGYGTLTPSGRPFQQRSPAERSPGASNLPIAPDITFNPTLASAAACAARMVWAPPGSLAATTGILSVPRGTEMFQFPRFPPRVMRGPGLRQGVAPFGDRRITGHQPLPDAFRRVVTSFLGPARPGIHHVRFSRTDPPMSPGASASFVVRAEMPQLIGGLHTSSRPAPAAHALTCQRSPSVEPRGFEPRTSAVQKRRSPG